MNKTVCTLNQCVGCNNCVLSCPSNCISLIKTDFSFNCFIEEKSCIKCKLCETKCPIITQKFNDESNIFLSAKAINKIDGTSSSGIATEISSYFYQNGWKVIGCCYSDNQFKHIIANSRDDISKIKGSKYVQSNLNCSQKDALSLLKNGNKVLFIGTPCQVSAVKNYCSGYLENLFCIDLICHGVPNQDILLKYLDKMYSNVDTISFRTNKKFGIKVNNMAIKKFNMVDEYILAFLSGIDYLESCYNCKYAITSRVGDLTLGDDWITNSNNSLVICNNEKGIYLLNSVKVKFLLSRLDKKICIQSNKQLSNPTQKSSKRDKFISCYKRKGLIFATNKTLKKSVLRQRVKGLACALGVKK